MKTPKSKYKGVYVSFANGKTPVYQAQLTVKGVTRSKTVLKEREAAKHYDLMLIEAGREPVNVLKRK